MLWVLNSNLECVCWDRWKGKTMVKKKQGVLVLRIVSAWWFSNVSEHHNLLGGFLKWVCWTPHLEILTLPVFGGAGEFAFPSSPGGANAAGQDPALATAA